MRIRHRINWEIQVRCNVPLSPSAVALKRIGTVFLSETFVDGCSPRGSKWNRSMYTTERSRTHGVSTISPGPVMGENIDSDHRETKYREGKIRGRRQPNRCVTVMTKSARAVRRYCRRVEGRRSNSRCNQVRGGREQKQQLIAELERGRTGRVTLQRSR